MRWRVDRGDASSLTLGGTLSTRVLVYCTIRFPRISSCVVSTIARTARARSSGAHLPGHTYAPNAGTCTRRRSARWRRSTSLFRTLPRGLRGPRGPRDDSPRVACIRHHTHCSVSSTDTDVLFHSSSYIIHVAIFLRIGGSAEPTRIETRPPPGQRRIRRWAHPVFMYYLVSCSVYTHQS